MGIRHQTTNDAITASMIDGLFVGWPTPPGPDKLLEVMAGSYRRVWALEGERVVGHVNAISDGVLNAFIAWLEVHPDAQGRGIGGELVRRIGAELDGMYAIDLLCDAELVDWYRERGFWVSAGACVRNRAVLRAV